MLKLILFDLDGTLLPMDQDAFTKGYFKLLAKKLSAYGYEPQKLIDSIWKGMAAMVKNEGSRTNEEAFWQTFTGIYGEKAKADLPVFESFYENEFQQAKELCGFQPEAAAAVRRLKEMGFRVALATNPIFPAVATRSRIRWAGLDPDEFELYTTYENTCYCKPNPLYFEDVAKRLHTDPAETLMAGNDALEDLAAARTGMKVFLLTDCLINKEKKELTDVPQGSFSSLLSYIEGLCGISQT